MKIPLAGLLPLLLVSTVLTVFTARAFPVGDTVCVHDACSQLAPAGISNFSIVTSLPGNDTTKLVKLSVRSSTDKSPSNSNNSPSDSNDSSDPSTTPDGGIDLSQPAPASDTTTTDDTPPYVREDGTFDPSLADTRLDNPSSDSPSASASATVTATSSDTVSSTEPTNSPDPTTVDGSAGTTQCSRSLYRRCGAPPSPEEIEAAGPSGDRSPDAGGVGDDPDLTQQQNDAVYASEPETDHTLEVDQEALTGTPSNRFLDRLSQRIRDDVPDQATGDDRFISDYEFNTKTVEDLLADDQVPGHSRFRDMFSELGITFDTRGLHSYLDNGGRGFDSATQRWTSSSDSKAAFAEWSFKDLDLAPEDVQRLFPEKSVYMLQKAGVDLTKLQTIGRVNIVNPSTTNTMRSVFARSPKVGPKGDMVRLRWDSTDAEEQKLYNSMMRTPNGSGVANMLAYFHQGFGNKQPGDLILKEAAGKDSASMLVALRNG